MTFESAVSFIASYPLWAKVVIIACFVATVSVLVLAPRTPDAASSTSDQGQPSPVVYLKIDRVELFTLPPETAVRITAFVNGSEFRHPNVGGIEWIRVGPAMGHKVFRVPRAPRYEVRFEMGFQEAPTALNQRVEFVDELPVEDFYNFYPTETAIRSSTPAAKLHFRLYEGEDDG